MRPLLMLLIIGCVAVPAFCLQKKVPAPAPAMAAAPRSAAVTDDIYVEIKAHEAAFLAAGLKDKQALALGTMEQKMEFARQAQKRREAFAPVRTKLLAQYKVSGPEFDSFESRLLDEGATHLQDQLKNIRPGNLKFDDKDPFNARAQRLAERIVRRTSELQEQKVYQK